VNAAVFAGLVTVAHWLTPGSGAEPAAESAAPAEFRSTLAAGSNGSRRLLPVEQIDWIAGAGDYCTVHLDGDEHLIDERLKALEASLDPSEFVRIHRSTIVRVDRIAEIRPLGRGDSEVRLTTGARLRVARRRRDQLEESLARRLEG
jgi:two-component system LytT family response regulator